MRKELSDLLQNIHKMNEGNIDNLISLHHLLEELPTNEIQNSLSLEDKQAIFYQAFIQGYIPLLQSFLKQIPDPVEQEKIIDVLKKNNAEILYQIDIDKQLDAIELLAEHLSEAHPLYRKLHHLNTFIRLAIHYKYDELIDFLQTLPSEEAQKLIHIDGDWLFIDAASRCHLPLMKLMLTLTPDQNKQYRMLHAEEDKPFKKALSFDHLDVAQWIYDHTLDAVARDHMIHSNDDEPFANLGYTLSYEAMKWLIELPQTKEARSNMIHAENDFCFLHAIDRDREDIMNLLWNHCSTQEQMAMIHQRFPAAVARAANSGHTHLIRMLINLIPDSIDRIAMIREILQDKDYIAFKRAAEKGNVDAMKELLQLAEFAHLDKEAMIHANGHEAFCRAAGNQQLQVIEFLKELTPDETMFYEMLRADHGGAFKIAMLRDVPEYQSRCKGAEENGGLLGQKAVNPQVLEFFFKHDPDYFLPLAKALLPEASAEVKRWLNGRVEKITTENIAEIRVRHDSMDGANSPSDSIEKKTHHSPSWHERINAEQASLSNRTNMRQSSVTDREAHSKRAKFMYK